MKEKENETSSWVGGYHQGSDKLATLTEPLTLT